MERSMFFAKDRRTGYLFNIWEKFFGPKRFSLLEKSWAGLFRREILPKLPAGKLLSSYCNYFGRPTKDIVTMLGVIIFQQMLDLTDEETVSQLAFNTQWHYALDITETSDSATYVSPKTLWNMRRLVTEKKLDVFLFDKMTKTLAKVFKVDLSKQRLDSVHIKSNMRRLGRIGLFTTCLNKFLVNLKRQHKELFKPLPEEMVKKYLSKKSLSCFSMVKPSKTKKTLNEVSSDLYYFINCFKDNKKVKEMYSYQLLSRVLDEQCVIVQTSDNEVEITAKPAKEVSSDSLQNPSDSDAGYDGHKGQGYQVQVMETYHTDKEDDGNAPKLNLITYVEVEPAHKSDAKALIPALKSTQKRGLGPKETLADTLYGSDENCQTAQKMGVELVSPTMGSSKNEGLSLADFEISPENQIAQCPQGNRALANIELKNDMKAVFCLEQCQECSLSPSCPVTLGKKDSYLHYDEKSIRLSRRRKFEGTSEFKDRYRFRAGAEATMSEYDRKTGVKHLRVRKLPAVRLSATLKALGVNIFRAAAI